MLVAYYVSDRSLKNRFENLRVGTTDGSGDVQAVVRFWRYQTLLFGMPNDEALHGHPLYSVGLGLYNAFWVQNSGWVRELERMNAVHPNHDPKVFERLKHFVWTFHDSMLECVAERYEVTVYQGYSRETVLNEMTKALVE